MGYLDISYCPMPCLPGKGPLNAFMARALNSDAGLSYIQASRLPTREDRSFHFPALELLGTNPKLAILGLTKGRTQVEAALKYAFGNRPKTPLSPLNIPELISSRAAHAVFMGKTIRANIGKLFHHIGVWDALGLKYDARNPSRSVDTLIADPGSAPHQSIYISSFIKCAMLTRAGTSEAPSLTEILNSQSANCCISSNLFRVFDAYPYLKAGIVFGKCIHDLIQRVEMGGSPLSLNFKKRGIDLIYLPHPSGAATGWVNEYCSNDISSLDWCTSAKRAREIIAAHM